MTGRTARNAAKESSSSSSKAAAAVPESVRILSERLIGLPNLTTHELVLLKKLRDGNAFREIEGVMGQLMAAPKSDTVVADALRKIIDAAEIADHKSQQPESTSPEEHDSCKTTNAATAILDKMFSAFPTTATAAATAATAAATATTPIDVLQRILSPGGPAITSPVDAAERYAISLLNTMIETFAIFELRDPVPQSRISTNNARAHILNELLPPRWPDLFRMIWRRVCGTQLVPPDPEMTEHTIIERFVNVSPEDVERMENLPQGSQEWLDARRFRVSGSTVASLVNLSPYASYEDWLIDKLYQQTYSNAAMRHGSITEAVARDYFERALLFMGCRNISIVERGFMVNPEMGGWAGASPDGLVDLDGGGGGGSERRAILEIKCPFYDKRSFYSEREKYDSNPWGIPEQYYCQIQYLMHLLGYKFSYFVVHLPHRTQIMLFVYNPPFATALYEAAKEVFYSKFIPMAAKYFRGELPFGCLEKAEDVLDLRVGPLLATRRRVKSGRSASASASEPGGTTEENEEPPSKKLRAQQLDEEARERALLESAEARIEAHIQKLGIRNEFDRYKWTISVRNEAVADLWSMLSACETDVEKEAFHRTLKYLPKYAIEDSERGRSTFEAFIGAMDSDPVETMRVLVEHGAAVELTSSNTSTVDFLSIERAPFEIPDADRERQLVRLFGHVAQVA